LYQDDVDLFLCAELEEGCVGRVSFTDVALGDSDWSLSALAPSAAWLSALH
jgi:hypothetical protein